MKIKKGIISLIEKNYHFLIFFVFSTYIVFCVLPDFQNRCQNITTTIFFITKVHHIHILLIKYLSWSGFLFNIRNYFFVETTVKEENGNSSSLLPPARYTSATTAYKSATTAYKSATVAEKTGSAVTTAYNSVAAAHVPNPSIVKAKTNSVHSTPANSVPSTHNKESDSRLKSGRTFSSSSFSYH